MRRDKVRIKGLMRKDIARQTEKNWAAHGRERPHPSGYRAGGPPHWSLPPTRGLRPD
jgi:hypothetical protein